jgi:hypothetical protein
MLLEQDKAFFWERIEDASKSMLCPGRGQSSRERTCRGCCWEKRGEDRAYCRERIEAVAGR